MECGIDPQQSFEKLCKEDGKKSNKGPWGRVKTIIQTRRDSLKRKQRKGDGKSEGGQSDVTNMDFLVHDIDTDDYGQDLETLSQASDRRSVDVLYDHEDSRCASRKSSTREPPKPISKVSRNETDPSKDHGSADYKDKKPKPLELRDESALFSEGDLLDDLLASPSSPTSQRRSRWTRMRKVFGKRDDQGRHMSRSAPSSPTSSVQGRTAFDFENFPDPDDDVSDAGHSITFSGRHPSTESGGGHPLTSCASSPMANIFHELQNNISEDFNKKIMEWERIRSSAGKCPATNSPVSSANSKADSSTGLSRASKNKSERRSQEKLSKQRIKDLSWLEKELQKVEREKQRLAKEKEKYEEKAARLQKLKETVISARNTNRNEVLIRTSAGEFRFEGISDAFTKKLYEWETKRGVGPDMSTIALLDSNLAGEAANQAGLDAPPLQLQRGMSKSESSVIDTGQPSQTSSNSLPSLKQDNLTLERLQPSRANSEPDLAAFSKEMMRAHTPRIDITGSSSNLLDSYGSNPETKSFGDVELGDASHADLTEEFDISQAAEDSYYNLLEENMFLLEQLKDKEDICRRLENEIHYLDAKMAEMNRLHHEEMEKYRVKLWEVHRPGSKPVDLEQSLQLVSELKCRIEDLEKNSDLLKTERHTLEDSFRYHSEQQAQLVIDLSKKMKELQNSRVSLDSCLQFPDEQKSSRCDRKFEKLHELSTMLLKQGRELERALAERTRQVCHLRWELLNRDVSTIHLQAELQSTRWKSSATILAPLFSPSRVTRSKRCWSCNDGLALLAAQNCAAGEPRPDFGLIGESTVGLFVDWPRTTDQPPGLSPIIHALKMELLKLSSKEALSEDEPERSVSRAYSEQSEKNYDHPYTSETAHSSPPEAGVFGSICSSPSSSYPAVAPEIKVRRNSADNMSSVSGPDCSESSSINENISFVLRLPSRRWAADNMSTSSESSYMEHYDSKCSWTSSRNKLKVPAEFSSEDNIVPEDPNIEEISLRYPLNLKRSRLRRDWSRGTAYRDRELTQEDLASEFSSEDQVQSDGYRSVSCPDSPANHESFFSTITDVGNRITSYYPSASFMPESVKATEITMLDSPDETPTYTVVLPRRYSGQKNEPSSNPHVSEKGDEPSVSNNAKDNVNTNDDPDLDTDTETKFKKDFQNLNVHRESPIIKSRSHRKLKSENSRDKSDTETAINSETKYESTGIESTGTTIALGTADPKVSFDLPTPKASEFKREKADPHLVKSATVVKLPTDIPFTATSDKTSGETACSRPSEDHKESGESGKVSGKHEAPVTLPELPARTVDATEQDTKHKGFLRLKLTSKRTQKKAEGSTVGALCRQSLFMNIEGSGEAGPNKKEPSSAAASAKSCPSSPEAKQKNKGGWFSKGIFKR